MAPADPDREHHETPTILAPDEPYTNRTSGYLDEGPSRR